MITYPVILVPSLVYTGNTLSFDVPSWSEHPDVDVSNIAFTVKWYARTRAALGATITGETEGSGWRITVPAATTATFIAGSWTWEIVATKTDGTEGTYTGGRGEFTAKTTASYSGTVNAYDNRSQIEINLDYVNEAIATLAKGGLVQEYSINGRSLRRYKMAELIQLRDVLKNEVNQAERKERVRQGLGAPGLAKVRFV